MKDELEKQFGDVEVEVIESKGGAFEVRRDGDLIFSKIDTGRFPKNEEIVALLRDG